MKLVTIDREFDVAHAELLRGRLQAAGFDAVIQGEEAVVSGFGTGTLGPVRLQVPAEQAEDATALIKDFDSEEDKSAE